MTLPRGTHNLRMTLLRNGDPDTIPTAEHVLVNAHQHPSATRVQIGRSEERNDALFLLGTTGLIFGVSGMLLGGSVALVAHDDTGSQSARNAEPYAIGTVAVGAGVTAVGALLMYLARGWHRDGSSTQWTPASGPVWVSE